MDAQGTGKYSGGTAMLNSSTQLHGDWDRFVRACRGGEISALDHIYENDPFILSSRAAFGTTPVHIAAEFGQVRVLNWLREKGADFSTKTRPRKQTPLHLAAEKGLFAAVKWLVDYAQALGCNIAARDYRRRTACQLAELYEHPKCVELLKSASQVPPSNGGKNTGWDALSREQLIQGLTDLKSLYEDEIEQRKEAEGRHVAEISELKSAMVDVRKELSELGSVVQSLLKTRQPGLTSADFSSEISAEEETRMSTSAAAALKEETAPMSTEDQKINSEDEFGVSSANRTQAALSKK